MLEKINKSLKELCSNLTATKLPTKEDLKKQLIAIINENGLANIISEDGTVKRLIYELQRIYHPDKYNLQEGALIAVEISQRLNEIMEFADSLATHFTQQNNPATTLEGEDQRLSDADLITVIRETQKLTTRTTRFFTTWEKPETIFSKRKPIINTLSAQGFLKSKKINTKFTEQALELLEIMLNAQQENSYCITRGYRVKFADSNSDAQFCFESMELLLLQWAIAINSLQLVKKILEPNLTGNLINQWQYALFLDKPVCKKYNPLQLAAVLDRVEIFIWLCDHNADIKAVGDSGNNTLHYARSVTITRLVLKQAPELVNKINERGYTPLALLLSDNGSSCDIAQIELLLAAKSNIEHKTKFENTLDLIASTTNEPIIRLLFGIQTSPLLTSSDSAQTNLELVPLEDIKSSELTTCRYLVVESHLSSELLRALLIRACVNSNYLLALLAREVLQRRGEPIESSISLSAQGECTNLLQSNPPPLIENVSLVQATLASTEILSIFYAPTSNRSFTTVEKLFSKYVLKTQELLTALPALSNFYPSRAMYAHTFVNNHIKAISSLTIDTVEASNYQTISSAMNQLLVTYYCADKAKFRALLIAFIEQIALLMPLSNYDTDVGNVDANALVLAAESERSLAKVTASLDLPTLKVYVDAGLELFRSECTSPELKQSILRIKELGNNYYLLFARWCLDRRYMLHAQIPKGIASSGQAQELITANSNKAKLTFLTAHKIAKFSHQKKREEFLKKAISWISEENAEDLKISKAELEKLSLPSAALPPVLTPTSVANIERISNTSEASTVLPTSTSLWSDTAAFESPYIPIRDTNASDKRSAVHSQERLDDSILLNTIRQKLIQSIGFFSISRINKDKLNSSKPKETAEHLAELVCTPGKGGLFCKKETRTLKVLSELELVEKLDSSKPLSYQNVLFTNKASTSYPSFVKAFNLRNLKGRT